MSFDFDEQDIGINIASNHVTEDQQPEHFSPTQEVERKALQESKQVVEAFLKRSLSQNAKSSLNSSLKPEGYHKLKKDGRLAYYQRQQSKPEHGNFTRGPTEKRHRSSASAQRNTVKQGLSLRSSLNELSSASNVKFESISRSVDGITDDTHVEDGILKKLLNSDQSLEHLPSSVTLQSGGDDGSLITRRRSFTRAVTRKSVISIIETNHRRDRHSSSEKRVKSDLKYTSKTPDPIRKTY
uniref:Uncharacterized protein n=1 Tax=Ciona savignyi TaxID=51511 RepID=H2YNW1_CIOSA